MVVNFGRRGAVGREAARYQRADKTCARERRLRQPAIGAMHVEPDRPELVMMALAHLEFRHPIKDLARIEIAENAPLELEQKRRMKRVGEIEENVRRGEPVAQLALRDSDATHRREVVFIARRILVEQAITAGQPCARSWRWKFAMQAASAARSFAVAGSSSSQIASCCRPPQPEHPLQRHGKISAAFAIFRRKTRSREKPSRGGGRPGPASQGGGPGRRGLRDELPPPPSLINHPPPGPRGRKRP